MLWAENVFTQTSLRLEILRVAYSQLNKPEWWEKSFIQLTHGANINKHEVRL